MIASYAASTHANAQANGQCLPAWRSVSVGDATIKDAHSAVRASDGFMYFGDAEGLHRAEGVRVRSWYPDPNQSGTLPAGRVRALAAADSRLFVGTGSGLASFDSATETFRSISLGSTNGEPARVFSLLVLDRLLIVGHDKGGVLIDLDTDEVVTQIVTPGDGLSRAIYHLEPFRDGVVASTTRAHWLINTEGEATALRDAAGEIADSGGYTAALDSQGTLWLGTRRGLVELKQDERLDAMVHPISLRGGADALIPRQMDFGPDGWLYIASDREMYRWNVAAAESSPELCRATPVGESQRSLPIRLLTWISSDVLVRGKSGAIPDSARKTPWVRRLSTDEPYSQGLVGVTAWTAIEDARGRLVLGTNQGVFRETARGSSKFRKLGAEVLSTPVFSVLEPVDGEVWAASTTGLFVLSENNARPIPLVRNPEGVSAGGAVISLAQSGDSVLAATDNGLLILDQTTSDIRFFFSNDPGFTADNGAPISKLPDTRTLHVEAVDEVVMVVGGEGVHRVDPLSGEVYASAFSGRDFDAGRLYATAVVSAEEVYIATANGLVRTDATLSHFDYLTEVHGQRIGRVLVVETDQNGGLWHSSDQGIWWKPAATGSEILFSLEDGLHTSEPNQGGMTISPNGRVVMVGPSGISLLDPELRASQTLLAPRLTRFVAAGQDYIVNDIEGVSIPAGPRRVSLEFGVNTLRLDPAVGLEYQLDREGVGGVIDTVDPSAALEFVALTAGRYELSARYAGMGLVSDWVTVAFIVQPFWWETRIARVAYGLTMLTSLLALYGWRSRRARRRYRLIDDERKRIAQDLHDGFLQDVIAAKMLSRNSIDMETAEGADDRIHGLLESAIASIRESVRTLADLSDLPALSEALRNYQPAMSIGRKIAFRVVESGVLWRIGKQRRFFAIRIAQEAINNAFKHSSATAIEVSLEWRFAQVRVSVTDDGVGFAADDLSGDDGFGLGAMRRMAKSGRLLLDIHSIPGKGTRVTLTIRRFWV